MKTKQIFSNIHVGIHVLFLSFVILLSGCTKDVLVNSQDAQSTKDEDLHQQIEHFDFDKRTISFSEFKTKLSSHDQQKGIDGRSPDDLSFILESNYFTAIDTTRIVEFSNNEITTYTFNVSTRDESMASFTNLIYAETAGEFSYTLVKYIPSKEWLESMKRGQKPAFDGEMELIDKDGSVLSGSNSTRGCSITAMPIVQQCYGSACPCTDGNGTIIGWQFSISCSSNGNTGGGGGGGSGNGSGSGGGGNGTDLPTDPTAWAIMVDMNNLIGPNDYFYFDPDIDPNNALVFNSFQGFADDYNGFGLDDVNVIEEQDETITTHYSFDTGLSDVNVYVNQTLRNVSTNENYLVHSIVTSLSGFTLGRTWQVNQSSFIIDEINNKATFHIYGTLSQDLLIEDFGLYYSRFIHLVLDINILTGQSMGVAILED